jgi:hypothetical protein
MAQGQRQPGIVFPTVLVSVLAALGIGVSMQRSGPTPPSPNGNAVAGSVASRPGNIGSQSTAIAMLENFLAVSALDRRDGRPALGDDTNTSRKDPRVRYRVRFLIETVPVPVSSALRASFDNDVDAITAAANDAGS